MGGQAAGYAAADAVQVCLLNIVLSIYIKREAHHFCNLRLKTLNKY
jgi:hypothetical protein